MSATAVTRLPAGTYNVDPSHSNVGFEVRHMGIATVRGTFRTFEGVINDGSLQGAVEVASIDSGDQQRDAHLASPEFFDAERQPQIRFHSETVDAEDGRITLAGEITIKGITKPIELNGTFAQNGEDPSGNERLGVELEGRIDRRDFDLKRNQTLPNGSLLVANEVKLLVSVSAVRAA